MANNNDFKMANNNDFKMANNNDILVDIVDGSVHTTCFHPSYSNTDMNTVNTICTDLLAEYYKSRL